MLLAQAVAARRLLLGTTAAVVGSQGVRSRRSAPPSTTTRRRLATKTTTSGEGISMTNKPDKAELRQRLTPLQFHITQEKGTERPFTGCYNKHYEAGAYTCIVCEQELFTSEHKYDSGCGWPAFNDVLDQGRVKLTKDTTLNMVRTEVTCSNCGSHLGHVFNDGPKPKRRRFCINSASLNFVPAQPKE